MTTRSRTSFYQSRWLFFRGDSATGWRFFSRSRATFCGFLFCHAALLSRGRFLSK
jgi:hypothetical protein